MTSVGKRKRTLEYVNEEQCGMNPTCINPIIFDKSVRDDTMILEQPMTSDINLAHSCISNNAMANDHASIHHGQE